MNARTFYAVRKVLYTRTPDSQGIPWDCGDCGMELCTGHRPECVVGRFENKFFKPEFRPKRQKRD